MNCPKCAKVFEELYEEVDIGVGIQRHFVGYECNACGYLVAVCDWCGELLLEEGHSCKLKKFLNEERN